MFKKLKSFIPVILLVVVLLLPYFTLAQEDPVTKLQTLGGDSGYETDPKKTDLPIIVGDIIGVVLTLLGVIFLALFVYAGILWMIAAGNEDKVTRSKDTMRRAVIGLIIVIASYAISQFVVYSILK